MSQTRRYRDGIGVKQWSQNHNVQHELLPFAHRKIDPIETLAHLRAKFEEWPATKQTWVQSESGLDPNAIRATQKGYVELPEFVGCYKIDKDAHARYVNPQYVHSIAQTPKTKLSQLDHYLFYARVGHFSSADVADIYNVSRRAVRGYLQNHGYSWGDELRRGQLNFARTMETINKWEGTGYQRLAWVFGIPRTTLLEWRQRIEQPIPDRPRFKR